MKLETLRTEVAELARQLAADGLCPQSSGNVSAMDQSSGLIAITPSAIPKSRLKGKDIVIITPQGEVTEGHWKPTSELEMHTIFYRERPDVGAVIHTHAPYATIFAVVDLPLVSVLTESAAWLSQTIVPLAPYRRPGTEALARIVLETLGEDGNAALLEHHGLLTIGKDLHAAYQTTLAVEATARVGYMARAMGAEPKMLPPDEGAYMRNAIREYRPVNLDD